MCKVKGCTRPSFLGGLCGGHALLVWIGPDGGRPRRPRAPGPRRRVVAQPASG